MSFDLHKLLNEWDIEEEIIEKFRDNEIRIDQLSQLSEVDLKELCPKISARIVLRNKINEYVTAEDKTLTAHTAASTPSCSQNTDIDSDIDENVLLDMIACRPPFPEFDLRTLLSTSPQGNSILNYYSTNRCLTTKHRNILTDIIVRRIFTRVVNHRITHEEYNIITSKIIALFPTENAGTYFVPPVKKRDSISGKPGFARGKLVDKVRNTLFKSGERKRKAPERENINDKPKRSKNLQDLQDLHADDLTWLKNNTEPWEDAIAKWKSTFELRQTIKYDTVEEFIRKWPILNDTRSDVLINLDFEAMHPEKGNKFFQKWKDFITKVKTTRTNTKAETAALSQDIDKLEDDDEKLPKEIQLLCQLVPPKGRINKRTKISTHECMESLLVSVKTPGDIQEKIDQKVSSASSQCASVQPYIIQCEKNYYLVIDKLRYAYKSAYKAFDSLFKSYHALHVSYPKTGYHLYLLIQMCVYNIHTEYDIIPPYIVDLISKTKE